MTTAKPRTPAKSRKTAKTPRKVAKGAGKAVKKAGKKVATTTARADLDATNALAAHRTHPLARAAGWLAEIADQPPLIAASIGTLAIGLATRRGDLARGGARMLASHLLATGAKVAIKHRFDRTRPAPALDGKGAHFARGDEGGHDDKSFPSGHTAGAVAVARAAAHSFDGAAAPATAGAVAIAAVQAPAGHHYLTDVVVGGAVGWAAEAIVSAVFDRLEPKVEAALG